MESTEVYEALTRYAELKRQESEIKRKAEELKPVIVEYIKDNLKGEPLLWGGYRATVTDKSRKTLVGESVERIFGISLTDDCYRTTTFPELKVSRIND